MRKTHRRAFVRLLLLAVATPFVMAGSCSTQATTPQQIITDCENAVIALQTTFQQVLATAPGSISAVSQQKISSQLAAANTALAQLSASLAANVSAPIVQQVEQALNSVVTTVAGLGVVPQPFGLAVDAAAIILPTIEAFVNSLLQQQASSTVATRARIAADKRKLSVPEARRILALLAKGN